MILPVEEHDAGQRLDLFVAAHLDECTRSMAAKLVRNGAVRVNGTTVRPAHKVRPGERIEVIRRKQEPSAPAGEPIPLDVLFEDRDIIVVNKRAGMVVHPAPGNTSGTLVNALVYRWHETRPAVGDVTRPGIVHRLDKDTSGVMVVARTERAYRSLAGQIKDRSAVREYLALVEGVIKEPSGEIDAPVGRSVANRKRMAVTGVRSRSALTRFEVVEPLGPATLVRVRLETGRTHQIRVHMAYIGHPVVGDRTYRRGESAVMKTLRGAGVALDRQALHAARLSITHPVTGDPMQFEAPLPEDFRSAVTALRAVLSSEAQHQRD